MPDQRQHRRAPIELKVDYKKLNSFFADYTRNISKGGTYIKTKRPLPVGTRFLFRLTVPGRPLPFELSGEVVHEGPSGGDAGMGIRFAWGDDAERRGFESAVEELMSRSLGPLVTQNLLKRKPPGQR
jgi:type IV pilus assembly protein PilZ